MSDLERLAEAAWIHDLGPDEWPTWADLSAGAKDEYRKQVLAVLRELRQPSEAMRRAADTLGTQYDPPTTNERFTAMIDHIISEAAR